MGGGGGQTKYYWFISPYILRACIHESFHPKMTFDPLYFRGRGAKFKQEEGAFI